MSITTIGNYPTSATCAASHCNNSVNAEKIYDSVEEFTAMLRAHGWQATPYEQYCPVHAYTKPSKRKRGA